MILNTIVLGLIFSILGFGVFISFKVLSFTDLTAEASFTLGAAVAVMLSKVGLPGLGLFLSVLAGAGAGLITGFLHTKLKIDKVLSGILTLTAFYTINLLVTNFSPNISLAKTVTTIFPRDNDIAALFISLGATAVVAVGLCFFFKTKLGLSIRAAGDNETMIQSAGVSLDAMKLIGLALSNGLIAFSGALFMQYQRYYDSTFGTGMMVVGVATIVIGEIFTFRRHQMPLMFLGITIGSVIYRFLYLLVIRTSGQPQFMKLLSAVAITLFVVLSKTHLIEKIKKRKQKKVPA